MQSLRTLLKSSDGVTMIELLIAVFIAATVAAAAMEFYVTQHDTWVTQESVAEMQQNLRASIVELSQKIRNAGAELPMGLPSIDGADTNPDTLMVRFSASGTTLTVGDPTNKRQAVPIHVDRHSDFTGWETGDRVFIWRPPAGPGEFFTITKLADNAGTGWMEVHHQNEDLINDPQKGDKLMKMEEFRYWIDSQRDTLHPCLIRSRNGIAEVFAEDIYDLQLNFVLANDSITSDPGLGDKVKAVDFNVAAQTNKRELTIAGEEGKLTRLTRSRVVLRNSSVSQ